MGACVHDFAIWLPFICENMITFQNPRKLKIMGK